MSDHDPPRPALPLVPLRFERSRQHIFEGSEVLAGGVSSNFRLGISPTPLVFDHADGPYLVDIDGNRLIDYYLGMGPDDPRPHAARRAARRGTAAWPRRPVRGAKVPSRPRLPAWFARWFPAPSASASTRPAREAVQGALRLARAFTGRQTVVKVAGHYHGWFDNVLWSTAPAAGANAPVAGSLGQPEQESALIAALPWNDLPALRARLQGGDVAAVIMEPAMCNAGAIEPLPGYLEGARDVCSVTGTVLIFDEVITGFRLGAGGAQGRFGVTPDLATFAKAIAAGFPVAAIAGRADIMELCTRGVVHGGTYNGQAVTMAACVATLQRLRRPGRV